MTAQSYREQTLPMFEEFFHWCEERGIHAVVAAGNLDGAPPLHRSLPQALGTADNNIITVGGITRQGTLWPKTALHEDGKPGSITLFAPAEGIVVPGPGNVMVEGEETSGTSQATAMVVSVSLISMTFSR